MLLTSGHAHLLRGWPRRGVHDEAKHAFLRTTAQRLSSVFAVSGNDRVSVLKVCHPAGAHMHHLWAT